MRLQLALAVGKIVTFVTGLFHRGTNLPGELALKICPTLFGQLKISGTVIAVTGSNGKTTTSQMISHILQTSGHQVISNSRGSNLSGGIATALLRHAGRKGQVSSDFFVLETDERYARIVYRDFHPDFMVVTNLFRDQPTRNGNVDLVTAYLQQAVTPDVRLVLNADDPLSCGLSPQNQCSFFSLDKTALSSKVCTSITNDAKCCPNCGTRLSYEYYHYNHIGKFACGGCGFSSPDADYTAGAFDVKEGRFQINGHAVTTSFRSLYQVYNLTAAVAVCSEAGIPLAQAIKYASGFQIGKQRFQEFEQCGRHFVKLLSKNQNPVSYDQSIAYIMQQDGPKTLVVAVNDINHTGYKDTTWLYDVNFEQLHDQPIDVICTGERAFDLAVRLEQIPQKAFHVITEPDIKKLGALLGQTHGTVYLMTEIYDANKIMEGLHYA